MLPTAGDGDQIVGPAPQLLADVVNQKIDAAGLADDLRGVRRTSYSLRHFYVSQQLAHGVPIHDLARNTRTSIAMIDKHYAQVTVDRMKDALRPEWGGR